MKKIIALLLTLAMLFPFTVPASAETSGTVDVDVDVTYDQTSARSMLKLINDWRAEGTWYLNSSGQKVTVEPKEALVYDYDLEQIAMKRAAELAAVFAHKEPDGSDIFSMTCNGRHMWAENIAGGSSDPESVFEMWQENDDDYKGQGHRRNMLGIGGYDYTTIGIGHAIVNGVNYWVQDFGTGSPVSDATDPCDEEKTVTLSIARSSIEGLDIDTGVYYTPTVKEGEAIQLPECSVRMIITDGWGDLPLKDAAVSWGETDDAVVDGDTITINSGHNGETITLPITAEYDGITGTADYRVKVCSHRNLEYEKVGYEEHSVTCKDCGERLDNEKHDFGDPVVISEATCEDYGVEASTCSKCGYTKKDVIPALGHDWVTVEGYPATADSEGLTDGEQCSRCGEWKTPQRVIPKLSEDTDNPGEETDNQDTDDSQPGGSTVTPGDDTDNQSTDEDIQSGDSTESPGDSTDNTSDDTGSGSDSGYAVTPVTGDDYGNTDQSSDSGNDHYIWYPVDDNSESAGDSEGSGSNSPSYTPVIIPTPDAGTSGNTGNTGNSGRGNPAPDLNSMFYRYIVSLTGTSTSSGKKKPAIKPVTGKGVKRSGKNLIIKRKNVTLRLSGVSGKKHWSSSNKKIAVVRNGKVTFKKKGTVKISCRAKGRTYKIKVTCKKL